MNPLNLMSLDALNDILIAFIIGEIIVIGAAVSLAGLIWAERKRKEGYR